MEQPDFQKLISEFNEKNNQLWKQWSEMIRDTAASGDTQQIYERNLEMVEKLVGEMLETEQKLIESWRGRLAGNEHVPEQLRSMTEGFSDAMQTMLENRRKLWTNWLEQARKMSPQAVPNLMAGQDGARQMIQMWEDFYKQVQKSQEQMLSNLGGGQSGTGKK